MQAAILPNIGNLVANIVANMKKKKKTVSSWCQSSNNSNLNNSSNNNNSNNNSSSNNNNNSSSNNNNNNNSISISNLTDNDLDCDKKNFANIFFFLTFLKAKKVSKKDGGAKK